jgi:shikimate kinase
VKQDAKVALIGFRASGKSLIGRLLAQKGHLSFVDMDERLVAAFGKDIDQWVRAEGWESFRKAESELLEELARGQGLVVATGGGVILSAHNRRALKNHFLVIWLKASLETTCSRLLNDPNTGSQRPPLTALPLREEIEQTLAARSRLYEETAHIIVETDAASPDELVLRLQSQLWPERKAGDGAGESPAGGPKNPHLPTYWEKPRTRNS